MNLKLATNHRRLHFSNCLPLPSIRHLKLSAKWSIQVVRSHKGDVPQCAVWTDVVAMKALVLNENPNFLQSVKRLTLQKIVL